MRPSNNASFADRRVRPVFLIVLGISLLVPLTLGRSQTSYTYTAETENPTRKKGGVTVGALKWECIESRCTINGSWPTLGVESCQALARAVGRIKSFGRSGFLLDASQMTKCNSAPSGGVVLRPVGAPTTRFCDDCDGDLHRSPTAPLITRRDAAGDDITVSSPGDDCDDADPDRFPGNPEHCDLAGHDEDCNPTTVGDKDEDGDGHIDKNCSNPSGETLPISGDDCDDTKPGVHPGSPEVCNGYDDDCDNLVDAADPTADLAIWVWEDRDRDGFGRSGGDVQHVCLIGDMRGSAINDYDCDDANPRRHPGAGCP